MENNISFSKIVATPTLNSWSQAYNAGKLFAVLSLEKISDLPSEIESLNMLGRDLLERLEQEFFAIENKDLETIRKAFFTTFQNKIENIKISFAAGAFINNVLYLFSLGNGKVFIKREGNFGQILGSENSKEIISSSGLLKEADLIVISTNAFSEVISNDDLNSALNDSLPSEITESLAPKIHKAENGKTSAIIIRYGSSGALEYPEETDEPNETPFSPAQRDSEEKAEKIAGEKPTFSFIEYFSLIKSKLKMPNIKIKPARKPFLIAIIVIAGILIFSIFTAIQKQNNAKIQALFAQIYPEAQKKYDEGQSLTDLNKNLARDSFLSAQKILQENKDKFPAKSKELIQTQDLLKKIDEGLTQVSPVDKSGLDRSKLSITVTNGSGIEGTAGKAATILKDLGYNVTSTGNADNFDYQGVTIKAKKESSKFLDLLKKDLAKDYAIKSSSSDLSPDSSTDSLIIIGK
ncbi:MAG: LytR C-terminal domain-containing protein [Candidatus Levybacteria bacterium]|nr:LytR C-terminal domain-containing protein [Candidatus Levybacteria bacterium]